MKTGHTHIFRFLLYIFEIPIFRQNVWNFILVLFSNQNWAYLWYVNEHWDRHFGPQSYFDDFSRHFEMISRKIKLHTKFHFFEDLFWQDVEKKLRFSKQSLKNVNKPLNMLRHLTDVFLTNLSYGKSKAFLKGQFLCRKRPLSKSSQISTVIPLNWRFCFQK